MTKDEQVLIYEHKQMLKRQFYNMSIYQNIRFLPKPRASNTIAFDQAYRPARASLQWNGPQVQPEGGFLPRYSHATFISVGTTLQSALFNVKYLLICIKSICQVSFGLAVPE